MELFPLAAYPLAESHVYVAIVRGPDPAVTLDNATVEWETEGGNPQAFPAIKEMKYFNNSPHKIGRASCRERV